MLAFSTMACGDLKQRSGGYMKFTEDKFGRALASHISAR